MKQNTNTHGFQHGNQCAVGHGRKPGQTIDVRVREVMPTVIDNLISAAKIGDVVASAALLNQFGVK